MELLKTIPLLFVMWYLIKSSLVIFDKMMSWVASFFAFPFYKMIQFSSKSPIYIPEDKKNIIRQRMDGVAMTGTFFLILFLMVTCWEVNAITKLKSSTEYFEASVALVKLLTPFSYPIALFIIIIYVQSHYNKRKNINTIMASELSGEEIKTVFGWILKKTTTKYNSEIS